MNKKMVITAVCLLAMSAMMAQNITGKVVDTKGEPLPFANVMLLNRADSAFVKGAVSGEDGSFTINASCNGGIIKVSSVGYTTVFQDCVGGDLGVVRLSEDS
ncbi:MAG: carboxypeptidase-like regulatory domain-containing protein, partial [Bacteroidales bacterium]|nr:carboxypeptidase-like regulatory domain-containing protein [Bacteroidales bacterium]